MRRLLVLASLALLPACMVEIDAPESEEIGSENSGLVQESEGTPAPEPEQASPANPEVTSPTTQGPTGPTPDPWNASGSGGPTPDPWVIPVESDAKKKTAH